MDPDARHVDDAPAISPAGRRGLAVAAWACALLAPVLVGVGILLGIAGMILGSGAHLKGDRLGMPAAVVSGLTSIVAMAIVFWQRI
jgi:hypothetical protein